MSYDFVTVLLTISQAKQVIYTAGQYVLAMSIELSRRALVGTATELTSFSEEDKKRALELSAYFTVPAIEPQHQTLALFTAMNFANKNKQLSSALGFANALIERGTNARFKETVSISPLLIGVYTEYANNLLGEEGQGNLRAPTRRRCRGRIRHLRRIRDLRCFVHPDLCWRAKRQLSL